jgi:hypothetical protein
VEHIGVIGVGVVITEKPKQTKHLVCSYIPSV